MKDFKVKVKYDVNTFLVNGYFPDFIDYSNSQEYNQMLSDGNYIEITQEEYNNRKDIMVVKDGIFQEYQKSQEEIDAEKEVKLKKEIEDARLLKLQELQDNYINSQTFIIKATDIKNKIANFNILVRENWNKGILTSLRNKVFNANFYNINVDLFLPNTIGIYKGTFSKEEVSALYKEIITKADLNEELEVLHKVKILYLKTKEEINNYKVNVFEKDFTIDFDVLIGRSKLFELQS